MKRISCLITGLIIASTMISCSSQHSTEEVPAPKSQKTTKVASFSSNLKYLNNPEAKHFKDQPNVQFYNGFSFGNNQDTVVWWNPKTSGLMFEVQQADQEAPDKKFISYFYYKNPNPYKLLSVSVDIMDSRNTQMLFVDRSNKLHLAKISDETKPNLAFSSRDVLISSDDQFLQSGTIPRESEVVDIPYLLFGDGQSYKFFTYDRNNSFGIKNIAPVEPKQGYEFSTFSTLDHKSYSIQFVNKSSPKSTYVIYDKFDS